MKSKLEFLIKGSEVSRYHTIRTIQQETVGHHSHGVATLCLILEPYASTELIEAALFHDLAEHQLGDLPSTIKKKYGIGEQVNKLEAELLNSVDWEIPLTERETRLLKLADIFQGMIFCSREIQMGNRGMWEIFHRYATYARDMGLVDKELELFSHIWSMTDER